MTNLESFPRPVRRLWFWLSVVWSAAWILGIGLFTIATIVLAHRLYDQQLDARLRTQAIAVYGLAFFNDQGTFESDLLDHEDDLFEPNDRCWIVEPGKIPIVHLGIQNRQFEPGLLNKIAGSVVDEDSEKVLVGLDQNGRNYRLLAIPTYENSSSTPKAAIIVAADPTSTSRALWRFVATAVSISGFLGLIGICVGALLARWSLKPLAKFVARREQFLAAAAHELRTPMASLQAVHESAMAGDEPAEKALQRMGPLVHRAVSNVEDLLLYARLDAGSELVNNKFRLDLLVENCIPESSPIKLEALESIVLGDDKLIATAVRNLIANSLRYASTPAAIRVNVNKSRITVEDDGPGFPVEVLKLSKSRFTVAPSTSGSGLGLATVQMIVQLHDGYLQLENLAPHGARATLVLSR